MKQLTTTQIFANLEMNSLLLGKFSQILLGGLAGRIAHPGSQEAVRKDCAILVGKASFPLGMHNFQGEDAQPAARPCPDENLVRGMDQL